MKELDVILEYRRKEPCWVCAECDSENVFSNSNCLFCGRARANTDYVIREWTESVQNNTKVAASGSNGGTVMGGSASTNGNNPYTVWIIIGIIVFLILIFAATSGNACEADLSADFAETTCSILESSENLIL